MERRDGTASCPHPRSAKDRTQGCCSMSFFGTNDAEDGQDRSSELVVILTNPESCNVDERDCPITMERFDKSDVDFLPGARVIPSRPSLCVAVLPCGHKFGAVPLIYHMLRSGMRCPCCRAGCGSLLDPGSIPSHIRDPMLRHCNRMRWRELDEQQAGEAQELMDMMLREQQAFQASTAQSPPPPFGVLLAGNLGELLREASRSSTGNDDDVITHEDVVSMMLLSASAPRYVDSYLRTSIPIQISVYFYTVPPDVHVQPRRTSAPNRGRSVSSALHRTPLLRSARVRSRSSDASVSGVGLRDASMGGPVSAFVQSLRAAEASSHALQGLQAAEASQHALQGLRAAEASSHALQGLQAAEASQHALQARVASTGQPLQGGDAGPASFLAQALNVPLSSPAPPALSSSVHDDVNMIPWLGIHRTPVVTAGLAGSSRMVGGDTQRVREGRSRFRRRGGGGNGDGNPPRDASLAPSRELGLQGMHLIQADMNPVYDASSGDDGQVYEMDPGGIDQINRWIETHQAAMFRFSIHTRSILTNEAVLLCNSIPFSLDTDQGQQEGGHRIIAATLDDWFSVQLDDANAGRRSNRRRRTGTDQPQGVRGGVVQLRDVRWNVGSRSISSRLLDPGMVGRLRA